MPLRSPVLDDRTYAQLRDELIARIPVYAPQWTDHHPSDPGITLLELFAFLGENLLYRFNQIPDATKMAFLDLLDVPMLAAEPATGHVRFSPTKTNGSQPAGQLGKTIPRSTRLLAGDVPFQTMREVTVWPVSARAAIRGHVTEQLDRDTIEHLARTAQSLGINNPNATTTYETQFGAIEPSQSGGDRLDPVMSIDGSLYVAVLAEGSLSTEMAGGLLTLGVVPSPEVPSMLARAADNHHRSDIEGRTPPIEWQICTTEPVPGAADPRAADPIWKTLDLEGDTTGGMTRPGVVDLRLPDDLSDIGLYRAGLDPDSLGAGDQPPLVEDPEVLDKLAAWLRVFRPGGGELPAIDWLDTNVAPAEQALSARAEFLGTGSGEASQVRSLVHADVLGEVELDVEEIGAGRFLPWSHVEDFGASTVDDRHFTVDREAGTVKCGDGRRGRTWQIGERIRVSHYRYGGGAAGNVARDSVTKAPATPGVKVTNPLPLRGGADAEPLPDAVARIPDEIRRNDRAVTASDFRELAELTPGAGVARAESLRLFSPHSPTVDVPGAVSVVVFPSDDRRNPNAPKPDRTTLDAVCRHLDDRRLVTTELYVIPPEYRRIAVAVGVSVKPGHGIESVRRWVELVVRQFLAPLPPFGPEGRGWPLGRRVFAPELEAAALQVEGVEFLEPGTVPGSPCLLGLRLAVEEEDGEWVEPASRAVELERWQVPELAEITVVAGPAMTPGEHLDPAAAPGGPPVPIRRPREVC